MFRINYFLLLFTTLLLLTACNNEASKVTKEQAAAFSIVIENEVRDMKINFLEKNILLPVFMERIYETGELKSTSGLEQQMKKMLSANSYEKNIYEIMGAKGRFKKVKQYEKEGRQHIIYRVSGEGGFTYMDMEIGSLKAQVGIADMFLYNTGENLSASVADLLKKLLSPEHAAIAAQLETTLNNLSLYLKDANYEFAKKEFERLPYDIRNNKLYEMRYLEIMTKIGGQQYLDFQQKIETKYADDAGFQLMMIDVYLNQKKYDQALISINTLDSFINKDPFLEYYRGLILNMKGEPAKAITHFEKIVKADPQFADPYPDLVVSYAEQKQYDSARRYFELYKALRTADKEVINYVEAKYPDLK